MTFGERVRSLRRRKRLSQNALAEMMNVSPRTIFGYEAGTTYPRTRQLLERLARALDVTSEELLENTPSPESFAFIRADHSARTQARILTRQVVAALSDETLPEEEKDKMARAIMNAYWESKKIHGEQSDRTKQGEEV